MICTVEGCTSPKHGRGYCRSHYMRWWRYGDPLDPSSWRKKAAS